MLKPQICVTLIENEIAPVRGIESEVDLFEVRLDLVGPDWPKLVAHLRKPWIACCRSPEEGGRGSADEGQRVAELLKAVEVGAIIVDIELQSAGLARVVPLIKAGAKCLISYHDLKGTPSESSLTEIVNRQTAAGADICKVITTARDFADNLVLLRLIRHFSSTKIVAFAMGELGKPSRILSPLAGSYFTYASLAGGKESAVGQLPVKEMRAIYDCLQNVEG
jgi:3-dehydroquinate dehydratase I